MAKQCIGIDIGTSAIKLVQLKISKRQTQLQNFGIEPLPPSSIVDGAVMNHGAVRDALKTLQSRIHLKGKDVAMGVGGNSVMLKRISIPHMEGAALAEQVDWEAKKNIPNVEEVIVDHAVLVEQTPQGQMEVMLVAAKRDVVEQQMQIIREVGLTPRVVDTAAFAVQNSIESAVGLAPGETVAVVNVGAAISTISIVSDGSPVFTRDVATGGNAYTEAIQQRLAVSFDGAEAYKIGGAAAASADVVPQEVHRILAQISEQLAGEFQRSIDFYINDAMDQNLSRVYLSGGSSLVPQLPKAIQDRARIPVHILDPFQRTGVDKRRFDVEYLRANAPRAALAYGLALRSVGDC